MSELCSFMSHFENESTFWKWKHILKMKENFENESTFQKWKHILKMKEYFENERIFWKWKHVLEIQFIRIFWCGVLLKKWETSSCLSLFESSKMATELNNPLSCQSTLTSLGNRTIIELTWLKCKWTAN